ncbi:hypothetical protein ACFLXH_06190, partial [Chloroflexota bacterium]
MKNKNRIMVIAALTLMLVMATSLWFISPTAISYAQGGYEESPSLGGGGSSIPSSYTPIAEDIDESGVATTDIIAQTSDDECQILIPEGTTALNSLGAPLPSVTMIQDNPPPPPPSDGNIIGLVYNLLPSGASFEPAIILTIDFNPDDIPEGLGLGDLVIAYWDGSEWIDLEGPFTIDEDSNTISVPLNHFTEFTVIASPAPEPAPAPAPAPPA